MIKQLEKAISKLSESEQQAIAQIFNEPSIFNEVNKDNAQKFIDTVNDLETMWNKQCQKQFNREIIFSQVMQIKNTP